METDSSFEAGSMLISLPDRVFVVKQFFKNDESTTVTLGKFLSEKGLKAQKYPISLNGMTVPMWYKVLWKIWQPRHQRGVAGMFTIPTQFF